MILTDEIIKSLIKPRPRDCNKGDFGRLLCVVSCKNMTGAGILAAKSALRCGVGLCTVASTKDALLPLKAALPEAMTYELEASENGAISKAAAEEIVSLSKSCSAVLIGCGLSVCEDTKSLIKALLENITVPIILDADGINIAAQDINIIRNCKAPLIITPHLKEMSRLNSKSVSEIKQSKTNTALSFAKENGCAVVLKDYQTVIAMPSGEVFESLGGHSAMAKGGSGDVLAGMLSAFIASGETVQNACLLGVYLHARAGEICGENLGDRCVLASDIIDAIPSAFSSLK